MFASEQVSLAKSNSQSSLVSIAEYRDLLDDYISSDDLIQKRLDYLESYCRGIISMELNKLTSLEDEQEKK